MAGQRDDTQLDSLLDEALEGFGPAGVAGAGAAAVDPSLPPGEPFSNDGVSVRSEGTSSSGAAPAGLGGSGLKRPAKKSTGKAAAAEATEALQADKLSRQMAALMRDLADSTTGEVQQDAGGQEKILDLAATLSSLAEKMRTTAGPEVVPDEVNDAIFGKLTEQIGSMQETPEVQSLIDGLMQQLLSKEVLYQPMQDIAAKYPEWLAKQRGVLPEEELTKYEEQYLYIQEVCALYEAEPTDFEKVVEAMQKVQSKGQPPAEIVTELAPGLQFDADGLPAFPSIPGMGGGPGGAEEQCAIQ